MDKTWPVWPDDQMQLPDLGSDAPPKERESLDRGGRIIERESIKQTRVICQTCGFPKVQGLPCETCKRLERR